MSHDSIVDAIELTDLPDPGDIESDLTVLHYPTNKELADDELFGGFEGGNGCEESSPLAAEKKKLTAGASSPAAHQDPPNNDQLASAVGGAAGESSPRRVPLAVAAAKKNLTAGASSPAAHQDPQHTDQLASSVGGAAGESSPRRVERALAAAKKNKALPASVLKPPLLTNRTTASPSTAPKPDSTHLSTHLDGLLSSLGERELINVLTSAYKNHLDVRADVSVRATEAERKLYVHNLPLDSTPDSVEETFTVFGRIDDIVIRQSKRDKDKRRGSVLFYDVEGAARAVAAAKGMDLVCHPAKEGCIEECLF